MTCRELVRRRVLERGRGQPVLPRGAARRPARPSAGDARKRRARLRPGRPGDADRPAPAGGEGRAPGGRRDRPRLLARRRPRAARGRVAGLRRPRGARLHPPPLGLVPRRRARVRLQARAHARGRLRERAARAGALSCTPRFAAWLERVAGGRDEHAPYLAHHYAEAVRPQDADLAWADRPEELARLRGEAVAWLRRAGELAVGALRAGRGDRAATSAPSSWRRAWRRASSSGVRWASERPQVRRGRDAGRRCRTRSSSRPIRELQAELYSELALETACRSGMWRRMPDSRRWTSGSRRALGLAAAGSAARARALIAQGFWNPFEGSAPAREASAIAERLGDVELRSYAWDVRGIAEFVAGQLRPRPGLRRAAFRAPRPDLAIPTTSPTSTRRRSRAASGAVNFGRHVASPAFTTRSRCR